MNEKHNVHIVSTYNVESKIDKLNTLITIDTFNTVFQNAIDILIAAAQFPLHRSELHLKKKTYSIRNKI
jgi:hypothetical protein